MVLCLISPAQGGPFFVSSHFRGNETRHAQYLERKILKVQWERTGGFAGMRTGSTVDLDSLSQADARQLRELVEASEFFNLPEEITGPEGGADRFSFILTVETEKGLHTVHTGEEAAPPALRSLIQWLQKAARKGQRAGGAP